MPSDDPSRRPPPPDYAPGQWSQEQAYQPYPPPQRVGFMCPYCHTTAPPFVKQKISQTGWIAFIVLVLFCIPLCWIALFIKEDYRVCSSCGVPLG